ncbi:Uncharacterised protein [Delftia tsuruhatensis]|uniref:hypothetical protein n=1 Tax=Delftia tsuruhatensis TaxID=180282 RepID=UPI001E702545|nr:hypothetical protein [Delftia tsuruhatensis]CAB5723547.1 Uncharacterised protein [Delftia tsuruhatensis]CAC9693321.1 Uncharacterised protein [Delftia tsuruhatensis]
MNFQDIVKRHRCPLVNGIFLADGEVFLLAYATPENAGIQVLGRTRLDRLDTEDTGTIEFDYLGQACRGGHQLRFGEGSFGADGVAGLFLEGELRWFLFLDNCNPFCSARLDGDAAVLHSTSGAIFSVPLVAPQCLRLIQGPVFS